MRTLLCFYLLASFAIASPLDPAFNREHEIDGGADRGVIHHPPYGYPHCSGGWGYPTSSSSPVLSSSTSFIPPSPFPTTPPSPTATSTSSQFEAPTVVSSSSSLTAPITTSSSALTSSTSPTSSSVPTISTCPTNAAPPAPTQPGTVQGCSKWYTAQSGDFCYSIAQQFGLSVDTFMSWNPAVGPPGCLQLLAGDAYCVQVCGNTSLASISTSFTQLPTTTTSAPAPSLTLGPHDKYNSYCGDGSVAQGWPSMNQWLEFDYLFDQNTPSMKISCANWGVPDDSDNEIEDIKESINQIASLTGIDGRVILSIIMQESTGCVRVITTSYSHDNPGLMQSWDGTGNCNSNDAFLGIAGTSASDVTTPCPQSEIYQMILDGTNGTTAAANSGLRQNFVQQGLNGSEGYYRTAKIYNGGIQSFLDNESHLESGCCTSTYVSDIANRLMGWVNADRNFTC